MSTSQAIQLICGKLDRREISRQVFVLESTRLLADTLSCSRVGLWIFLDSDRGKFLRCLGLYDRTKQSVTQAPDESVGAEAFFRTLMTYGHIMADDVAADPATADLISRRPAINRVKSLIATAYSVNGRLFGAFTCTQLDKPRHWTQKDLGVLKLIGSRSSLALAARTNFTMTTQHAPLD